MNRTFFLTFILAIGIALTSFAQNKNFTGTINYKIVYPGGATGPLAAALPQSISMQIAGNKCKFELTLPNGKQTFIVNGDEVSVTRLLEMAEGKYFIKKTKEEFEQKEAPIIVPAKETKTVAGYKCKSSEINVKDRGGKLQKSIVFYSEELGTNNIYFNTIAKGIKGILLDFDYSGLGVAMHLTATEVVPGRVSNKIFEIPAGYTETTEAKLQQMRQANKSK